MGTYTPAACTTGVAVVNVTGNQPMYIQNSQMLVHGILVNNQPYTYYAGASWDRQGDILSADDWKRWVSVFYNELKNPLTIAYK